MTTGISLGFWFDNLIACDLFCKNVQGYAVWFLVSGWLLLYPLTERGHWLSVVMGCLYVCDVPTGDGCHGARVYRR